MIETHLNQLIKFGDNDKGYIGNNSLSWANLVLSNDFQLDQSLNKKFNRYELFNYCSNPSNENINNLVAVLSWGGMRRDHGRDLFEKFDKVDKLIDKLRSSGYNSRQEAFSDFQSKRDNGHLPGLGIGYFTKLICFLAPNLNGYIMDQWAGKSINLLTGENIVKINKQGWVIDTNKSHDYERYCNSIDLLSRRLNCTGFEAEKRIFSIGRGAGQWRNYLIKNYPQR